MNAFQYSTVLTIFHILSVFVLIHTFYTFIVCGASSLTIGPTSSLSGNVNLRRCDIVTVLCGRDVQAERLLL